METSQSNSFVRFFDANAGKVNTCARTKLTLVCVINGLALYYNRRKAKIPGLLDALAYLPAKSIVFSVYFEYRLRYVGNVKNATVVCTKCGVADCCVYDDNKASLHVE